VIATNFAIFSIPRGLYGPDFPGETFHVLKEKEERSLGLKPKQYTLA
jgi:hypothetical protein